jgi:hypothetical protein
MKRDKAMGRHRSSVDAIPLTEMRGCPAIVGYRNICEPDDIAVGRPLAP